MSDELLKQANDLTGDLAEFMPVAAAVVRDLAARVRELEAADFYVALKRNNDDLRERAERAEAERDAAMNSIKVYADEAATLRDKVSGLVAERDKAMERIEDLEWENKGIAEWREFGTQALAKAMEQRQHAERAESQRDTWMLACRNAERARDEAIEQRDRAEAERDLAARAHKAAEIAHAQMRAEQDALMQIALMWHSHEYIKRTIDAALKEKP